MADKTITIIGCGLIGGSIALALKRRNARHVILGIDQKERLAELKQSDAWSQVGTFDTSADDFLPKSEIIVLATPVKTILDLLPQISPRVKPDTVVTDVGSTKSLIVSRAREVLPAGAHFVGGHPIAGSEQSGFNYADPLLFKDRTYVLCPQTNTSEKTLLVMLQMVDELMAQPVMMECSEHDQLAAVFSHVPQLLAVVLMLAGLKADASHQLLSFVAGKGFLDMTRLACSSFSVWESILDTNNEALDNALNQLERCLADTRSAMRTGRLASIWKNARRHRQMLDPPGSGRKRQQDLRELVDQHDLCILKALSNRFQVVREIGNQKKHAKAKVLDSDRERRLLVERKKWAQALDLPSNLIDELFQVIIKHSKQLQQSLHCNAT